jgi:hypothetical protein
MTGLIRRVTILCAAGVLAATAALAGVPSATTSTQPAGLTLVGHSGGVADPTATGASTYTIRDASNNPVPSSVVILNYSACTDARICSTTQPAGNDGQLRFEDGGRVSPMRRASSPSVSWVAV